MAARREIDFHATFEACEALLFKSARLRGEDSLRQPAQRRTPPQHQRRPETQPRVHVLAAIGQRAGLPGQCRELVGVALPGTDAELEPRTGTDDLDAFTGLRGQIAAQPRHTVMDLSPSGRWRVHTRTQSTTICLFCNR